MPIRVRCVSLNWNISRSFIFSFSVISFPYQSFSRWIIWRPAEIVRQYQHLYDQTNHFYILIFLQLHLPWCDCWWRGFVFPVFLQVSVTSPATLKGGRTYMTNANSNPLARIKCCQLKFLRPTDTYTVGLMCTIQTCLHCCHIRFLLHVYDLTFISGFRGEGGRVTEEKARYSWVDLRRNFHLVWWGKPFFLWEVSTSSAMFVATKADILSQNNDLS